MDVIGRIVLGVACAALVGVVGVALAEDVVGERVEGRTVSIVNDGNLEIYFLYAAHNSEENGWGRDRLGSTTTLPPGERATVVLEDPHGCSLDIRIESRSSHEREYRGVDVCDGEGVSVGIEGRAVSIVNDGNLEIYFLYAAHNSEENGWGRDRLGSTTTLPPGERATVVLEDPHGCSLDIRIEGRSSHEREYRGVDVCEGEGVSVGIEGRAVSIVNDGNLDIYFLYASYGGGELAEERLGSRTLGPGEEVTVVLDDSGRCSLDIRIRGIHRERDYEGVDICGVDSINVELSDIIGTAFYIAEYMLITNAHVVQGCDEDFFVGDNRRVKVVVVDQDSDLALLSVGRRGGHHSYATLRTENAHQGEEVVIFGFPEAGSVMPIGGTAMASIVGSESDSFQYTISRMVPNGTSGSPVLDRYGNVIGVIASGRDELNISRAIKGSVLNRFLEEKGNHVTPRMGIRAEGKKEIHDIVAEAISFTIPVRCSSRTVD